MSLLKKKSTKSINLLEINGVTKSFGGLKAVNNCSFNVKKGSITGLIGPNGAGKTTLFNVITGQLLAEKGSIKIDGEEINQLPPYTTFNKGIVRTFQIPRELKRMTVLENLMVIKSNQSGENLFTTWFNPWKVRREENDNLSKAEEILDFLKDKIVSWWMPDDVVFVESLPHTATGKIQKLALREQFKDYKF